MDSDDAGGGEGHQSEDGAQHNMIGVSEAVQEVAPLRVNNWSSSLQRGAVFYNLDERDRDDEALAGRGAADGDGGLNGGVRVNGMDLILCESGEDQVTLQLLYDDDG